jgi:hypothetical protein
MRWTRRIVACMEEKCLYKVLVEKLEGKGIYGRPRNSLEYIKMGME